MRVKDFFIYQASATKTKPLCVSGPDGSWSLTFWLSDTGRVSGVLHHEYKNGEVVRTTGKGVIPAEYVASEENALIR